MTGLFAISHQFYLTCIGEGAELIISSQPTTPRCLRLRPAKTGRLMFCSSGDIRGITNNGRPSWMKLRSWPDTLTSCITSIVHAYVDSPNRQLEDFSLWRNIADHFQ